MSKKLSGSLHAHGCVRCTVRYQDACLNDRVDGLCTGCRGGRTPEAWIASAAPHSCCIQESRLVTKDEKLIYRLAGTRLWFICTTCSRTHPFNPHPDRTP